MKKSTLLLSVLLMGATQATFAQEENSEPKFTIKPAGRILMDGALYASPDKRGRREAENFDTIIRTIDIGAILKKKPLECSGGEKARAVFARGIIMKPQIILADEPTASLDVENRERIAALLFHMNKEFNTTIITVTHDLELANRHDRVIHLERRK